MDLNQTQQQYSDRLLQELGFADAAEQEKQEALEVIAGRFNDVLITTFIDAVNADQRQRLIKAFENPETVGEVLQEVAAEVPGLSEKIEQALEDEYEALKYAMNKK